MIIYSVGHSNRSLEELIALLQAHGVDLLVDVRTAPGSRRHPQFGRLALAEALGRIGIEYVHLPELGGLRRPRPDSPNTGWRNQSFRGYADYMQTGAWEAGLRRLIELAGGRRAIIMCAEAVPWRCHRSLIADALLARGIVVRHVLGPGDERPHAMTPFARVEGERITYPGQSG
ncbi:MAG TPA: DUF488 domain-containing protein [Candidatus Dormibacteraeota bacterium]|nr:DUF488 domain-containing protein [Candidatus Dormibacteraeota bacterium]